MTKRRSIICVLLITVFLWSDPQRLLFYWAEVPLQRVGWLCFLSWFAALLTIRLALRRASDSNAAAMAATSVVLMAAGTCADINLLNQLAMVASIIGLVNPSHGAWIAFLTASAWLPIADFAIPNPSFGKTLSLLSLSLLAGISTLGLSRDRLVRHSLGRLNGGSWRYGRIATCFAAGGASLLIWSTSCRPVPLLRDSTLFAKQGADYRATRIALAPSERIAIGSGTAARYFVVAGKDSFILTVIDSLDQSHVIHHPSVCHAGRGWKTQSDQTLDISRGEIASIDLQLGNKEKRVLFWFANGQTRHRSFVRHRLEQVLQSLSLSAESARHFVALDIITEHRSPSELLSSCSIFESI